MKQSISKTQFRDAFIAQGRKEQFSYEALGAIFDYIESRETDSGVEEEFDVISICCEYVEVEHNDVDEMENYKSCEIISVLGNSTIFVQS